jgi:hypothetical protein
MYCQALKSWFSEWSTNGAAGLVGWSWHGQASARGVGQTKCGLDSWSRARFWKNNSTTVRVVRHIQYNLFQSCVSWKKCKDCCLCLAFLWRMVFCRNNRSFCVYLSNLIHNKGLQHYDLPLSRHMHTRREETLFNNYQGWGIAANFEQVDSNMHTYITLRI